MGDISTISGIPRSANNLKGNSDIGGIDDQSMIEVISSFIFEEGYINGISDFNISTLTVFFTSFFIKISISSRFEILYEIIYIILCHYNFFYY